MSKSKILATVSVISIITVLLFAIPAPSQDVQFFLSYWDYPDEYGQGIYGFRIYENSSGSWQPALWSLCGYFFDYNDYANQAFEWNESIFIQIRVWTTLNKSLVGVSTIAEGKNYFRHSVSVIDRGTSVFSQQNFTFHDDESNDGDPIYYYIYYVVLGFRPVYGGYYRTTVTYEVYW